MSLLATILAATEHAAEAAAEHGAEAAAEHGEHDATPFYVVGGLLAAFAIVVSIIGFKKPDFPASGGAARGIMTLGFALVLATMASIVYVSA